MTRIRLDHAGAAQAELRQGEHGQKVGSDFPGLSADSTKIPSSSKTFSHLGAAWAIPDVSRAKVRRIGALGMMKGLFLRAISRG